MLITSAIASTILTALPPAPNGTVFRDRAEKLTVIGWVRRPHDAIIPRGVVVRGKEMWVKQSVFDDYGVKDLNICENAAGKVYLYPPRTVWLGECRK